MGPVLGRSAYDALEQALADDRCVILDGGIGSDPIEAHRRYVQAGCDVVRTHTRRLLAPARRLDWMHAARRSVRLARQAIAKQSRDGAVAVAFSVDAAIDGPEAAETIELLGRALDGEPPDLLLVEGLAVLTPTLEATVAALVAMDLPVWLSFRRCREGLCGVHGQHWGGPEGDAFGRAARRFEELGVDALLLGCIPPDHADGMVSYLRDFTDLPLGVHPNSDYRTKDGWPSGGEQFADLARRWREEGAQLVGGCCGVGPDEIAAARDAVAAAQRGTRRDEPARDALQLLGVADRRAAELHHDGVDIRGCEVRRDGWNRLVIGGRHPHDCRHGPPW
jgi:homocysteine S-methyltransferase